MNREKLYLVSELERYDEYGLACPECGEGCLGIFQTVVITRHAPVDARGKVCKDDRDEEYLEDVKEEKLVCIDGCGAEFRPHRTHLAGDDLCRPFKENDYIQVFSLIRAGEHQIVRRIQ